MLTTTFLIKTGNADALRNNYFRFLYCVVVSRGGRGTPVHLSQTAVDSITAGSNEFRMCFTDPAQGAKSAKYICEHGLATKVAVLYDSMSDYNSGVHDSFCGSGRRKWS